jgi:hypothetical protein
VEFGEGGRLRILASKQLTVTQSDFAEPVGALFKDLLAHQFFRLVPQKAIEQYGRAMDTARSYCERRAVQGTQLEAL